MAERVPRDQSLSRVYGAGALFAAGYGNVGSSIYYALGVTAAFALGLTPLAFLIAGVIPTMTARLAIERARLPHRLVCIGPVCAPVTRPTLCPST